MIIFMFQNIILIFLKIKLILLKLDTIQNVLISYTPKHKRVNYNFHRYENLFYLCSIWNSKLSRISWSNGLVEELLC